MPPTRTRAATLSAVRPVRIRDRQPVRSLGCRRRERSEGATRERDDDRGRRVTGAHGQGPIEVGDDE